MAVHLKRRRRGGCAALFSFNNHDCAKSMLTTYKNIYIFGKKTTLACLQFLNYENPLSFDYLAAIFEIAVRHRVAQEKKQPCFLWVFVSFGFCGFLGFFQKTVFFAVFR